MGTLQRPDCQGQVLACALDSQSTERSGPRIRQKAVFSCDGFQQDGSRDPSR
jgi:hypothetical protein